LVHRPRQKNRTNLGMTPLGELLIRRIQATGPITLADYMADCLMHPQHGYYATRDPFGAGGDFTTAPEISQMFGELLGLCLAQTWINQGAPAHFTLAELGPGRGTLMADVLRATKGVAGFHDAAQVMLIETSATLRLRQRATLGDHPVTWADTCDALPPEPLYLLANEFFDALPIRQFTRHGQGWAETMIGLTHNNLTLGKSTPTRFALLDHRLADTTPGDAVEICPALPAIMQEISSRIQTHGGAALVLDYGDWTSRGDTFQALKSHAFTDPLSAPGEADLTAHVDFAALAAHAPAHKYTTQGALLDALGLQTRAAQLAERLTGAALDQHLSATRRLTAPEEMGKLFKALAVYPTAAAAPPGFS
jgi:NADH dehydrogenase [ubiquinone] 1 alpha subcomplex assembly factor 7